MRWPALLALGWLCAAGCARDSSPAGRAGLPKEGHVRVLPTRIREDGDHFSWLWTIVGERNWTTAAATPDTLQLGASYPLNDRERANGTHIWEARITIERPKEGGGSAYLMQVQLRGSNAAMSRSSSPLDISQGSSLVNAARAIQTSEAVVGLPATLTLASVGRKQITLRVDR